MRAPLAAALSLVLAATACSGKGGRGGKKDEPGSGRSSTSDPTPVAMNPSGSAGPTPATTGSPPRPAAPSGRPNILLVVSDDQRADSIACMPRLKKMFEGGATFTSYFASTPLCCPGRTTLLTGRYAHNHGVVQNGDVEDGETTRTPGALDFTKNGNDARQIAKWLRDTGYRTGLFGKYLNGYDVQLRKETYVPPHWDDWHAFTHADYFDFQLVERSKGEDATTRTCVLSGAGRGKKRDAKHCRDKADRVVDDGKENYSTDVLKDRAVTFLRDAAKENVPFFMYFAPKAPHGPFQSPARYQPDRDKVVFTREAMERLGACPLFEWNDRPPSYLEKDVSDKPGWIRDLQGKHTDDKLADIRKGQLASVLATEDALGEILSVLEELGQRQNTVVVYLGDNGYAWGEHGYKSKNCAYGSCSHVPLLMLDPRKKVGAGRAVDAFTADIDIAPTFLDLAGVKLPAGDRVDGTSLLPLLAGGDAPWPRQELLTECWGNGEKGHPDTMAAVRTRKWLYIEHYEDDARSKVAKRANRQDLELYDLEKDPFETDNLLWIPEVEQKAKGYSKADLDRLTADLKGRLARLSNTK